MASAIPLTDEDRKDWLLSLNAHAIKHSNLNGAVIACSALKESYRKILKDSINYYVKWVFLKGSKELIQSRLETRANHFMPSKLLQSQFETLEIPNYGLHVDISESPDTLIKNIIKEFDL